MAATTDSEHAREVARRAEQKSAAIAKPELGNSFEVDAAVIKGMSESALPSRFEGPKSLP